MKFNKKLSKSGSITLPSALRREYGLLDGEKFSISVNNETGAILLERIQGECMFCGSEDSLIVFEGRSICAECVQAMSHSVAEMGADQ